MQEEALEIVLRRLSAAGLFEEARLSGEEHFAISCPFAKWKHKSGSDNRPSATVSFGNSRSVFKCHSCGLKMNLDAAVSMLNDLTGGIRLISSITSDVRKIEQEHRLTVKPLGAKRTKSLTDFMDILRPMISTPYPKHMLKFLRQKNVPEIIAKKFYCAYIENYVHPGKKRDISVRNAVLFPALIKIENKVLCVGAQVRPFDAGEDDLKYYSIFPFKSGRFLFGEHLLSRIRGKRIFLVEGPLDAMHLWSIGQKALGLFGLFMSTERAEKIKAAAPRKVFILLDPDQNEQQTPKKIFDNLKKVGVQAEVIKINEDPKQLTKEDLTNL